MWKAFESLRKTASLSEQLLDSSEGLLKKRVCLVLLFIENQLVGSLKMENLGLFWKKRVKNGRKEKKKEKSGSLSESLFRIEVLLYSVMILIMLER